LCGCLAFLSNATSPQKTEFENGIIARTEPLLVTISLFKCHRPGGGGWRRLSVSLPSRLSRPFPPPSPLSSPPTPPGSGCAFLRNRLNIEELWNEPPPAADLDDDTSLTYLHSHHPACSRKALPVIPMTSGRWSSSIGHMAICENAATIHSKMAMASYFATFAITGTEMIRNRRNDGLLNGRLIQVKSATFANCKTVTRRAI
jgi:hypothetical protein